MMILFGKGLKMVSESTQHGLTPNNPNADADLYGTIVLQIQATEVGEMGKSYYERRAQNLRGL